MNVENLRKVIAVMEEPGFGWCQGELMNSDGCMCAMGAACEAYRRDIGFGEWKDECFLGGAYAAPAQVVDWLGVSELDATGIADYNDTAPSKERVIGFLKKLGGIE